MQEIATFGAGCFWGVEAGFRKVPGVLETAVGYSGGKLENPTYKDVCTDTTGHAEVVQVTFDPEKLSYEHLLEVFFRLHDPTQVNRQGPDSGKQYRTAIFFHSPEQEATARRVKQALEASKKFARPIATEISPAATFWRAAWKAAISNNRNEFAMKRYLNLLGAVDSPCRPRPAGWLSRHSQWFVFPRISNG
jgi:peptide-methionine (S)-S-oxide reductase